MRKRSTLAAILLGLALGIPAQGMAPPGKADDLRAAMRKLWEDHATWTRLFIVGALADLPDNAATTERLLQNQTDIGNAVKPFYGDAAGGMLTALLREHILIAADIVKAAKAGDTAKLESSKTRWVSNADEIAAFLSGANPKNWPAACLGGGTGSGISPVTRHRGLGYQRAHELVARSVLRKSPDGNGYALVCAPENEAAIYAEALTLNLWPRAQEFGGPVACDRTDPNAKGAPATARTITRSEPRTATTTISCPGPVTSCRSSSRRNARGWSRNSWRHAACAVRERRVPVNNRKNTGRRRVRHARPRPSKGGLGIALPRGTKAGRLSARPHRHFWNLNLQCPRNEVKCFDQLRVHWA